MKAMHSIAKITGKTVASAFNLSGFKTACDIGGKKKLRKVTSCHRTRKRSSSLYSLCTVSGCTGAMAYEFTEAHPGLSVIVFDLPAVVELNEFFRPQHTNSRVSFVAGQLLFYTENTMNY